MNSIVNKPSHDVKVCAEQTDAEIQLAARAAVVERGNAQARVQAAEADHKLALAGIAKKRTAKLARRRKEQGVVDYTQGVLDTAREALEAAQARETELDEEIKRRRQVAQAAHDRDFVGPPEYEFGAVRVAEATGGKFRFARAPERDPEADLVARLTPECAALYPALKAADPAEAERMLKLVTRRPYAPQDGDSRNAYARQLADRVREAVGQVAGPVTSGPEAAAAARLAETAELLENELARERETLGALSTKGVLEQVWLAALARVERAPDDGAREQAQQATNRAFEAFLNAPEGEGSESGEEARQAAIAGLDSMQKLERRLADARERADRAQWALLAAAVPAAERSALVRSTVQEHIPTWKAPPKWGEAVTLAKMMSVGFWCRFLRDQDQSDELQAARIFGVLGRGHHEVARWFKRDQHLPRSMAARIDARRLAEIDRQKATLVECWGKWWGEAGDPPMNLYNLTRANQLNLLMERKIQALGREAWAREQGWTPLMVTITCPSAFHSQTTRGPAGKEWTVRNPSFNEALTPKGGATAFQKLWTLFRSACDRLNLKYWFFGVLELQADATPHWHFVMWCRPQHVDALIEALRAHFLLRDWLEPKRVLAIDEVEPGAVEHRVKIDEIFDGENEKGARGATSYLMKLLSYLTNLGEEAITDGPAGAEALAPGALGRVRRFRTSEDHLTLWRWLRAMPAPYPIYAHGDETLAHAWHLANGHDPAKPLPDVAALRPPLAMIDPATVAPDRVRFARVANEVRKELNAADKDMAAEIGFAIGQKRYVEMWAKRVRGRQEQPLPRGSVRAWHFCEFLKIAPEIAARFKFAWNDSDFYERDAKLLRGDLMSTFEGERYRDDGGGTIEKMVEPETGEVVPARARRNADGQAMAPRGRARHLVEIETGRLVTMPLRHEWEVGEVDQDMLALIQAARAVAEAEKAAGQVDAAAAAPAAGKPPVERGDALARVQLIQQDQGPAAPAYGSPQTRVAQGFSVNRSVVKPSQFVQIPVPRVAGRPAGAAATARGGFGTVAAPPPH